MPGERPERSGVIRRPHLLSANVTVPKSVPVPFALIAVTVADAFSAWAVAVIDSATEQMTSNTEVATVASFIRLILVSFACPWISRAGRAMHRQDAARCMRLLSVESAGKFAPLGIVEAGAVRNVKPDPVQQSVVARHHLVANVVVGAHHRVGVEHLVGYFLSHPTPIAFRRLFVQARRHLAPPVHVEDHLESPGRGIERNLLANPGLGAFDFILI